MLPHLPQNMGVLLPQSPAKASLQFQHAEATVFPDGAATLNAAACCAHEEDTLQRTAPASRLGSRIARERRTGQNFELGRPVNTAHINTW